LTIADNVKMSNFQDDERENQTRLLFNLERVPGRASTDAILRLEHGTTIEFELKSTSDTSGSVTTVRDFGPDHIIKWKTKHWLFSFYEKNASTATHHLYGSPQMMEQWIQEKWQYVRPDFETADLVRNRITLSDMFTILSEKKFYSLEDARKLHKRQWTVEEYKSRMDLPQAYSQQRMLEIYAERVKYLISRGSTLNNPHIPYSYFKNWNTVITTDYANRLRFLVFEYLNSSV